MRAEALHARYGPGAVIAGGSEGIGFAFASILAEAGFELVLIARRRNTLNQAAKQLREQYEVTVHTVPADLSDPATPATIHDWMVRSSAGLLVYSAAFSPVGHLVKLDEEQIDAVVDVNCRGLTKTVKAVVPTLTERGLEEGVRGALILMSSIAGLRGAAGIAAYAASKAFITTFGEALWRELVSRHVDVLTCVAGATDTPGMRSHLDGSAQSRVGRLRLMNADTVAKRALRALGRRPVTIPGIGNKLAASVLSRLLPRRSGIRLLSRFTSKG